MLKATKLLALRCYQRTGVLGALNRSGWRRRRLLILGYHGVATADEQEWDPQLYVTTAFLRSRFNSLRRGGYAILPLAEAISRLTAGSLPERSVAITFDDGAADFFARAYPLLREFGFPATLYLTTYYCGAPRPVFNTMCRYLLWRGRDRRIDSEGLLMAPSSMELHDAAGRDAAFVAIRQSIRKRALCAEAKDELLESLAERVGVDYRELGQRRLLHLMSQEEIAQLDPSLIDIELHTHRHRVPIDRSLFTREIDDNRAAITRLTGVDRVRSHFCYPSGVTHPSFVPWLRELGVASATTCFPGMASRANDPLLLPRLVDTSGVTDLEFESWLCGAASFLPKRRVYAVAVD